MRVYLKHHHNAKHASDEHPPLRSVQPYNRNASGCYSEDVVEYFNGFTFSSWYNKGKMIKREVLDRIKSD